MAFRFQKRIKVAPGIRINLGKGGASLSAGLRGASITAGRRGLHANVGFPGTGLSIRRRINVRTERASYQPSSLNMTDLNTSLRSRFVRCLQLAFLWLATAFFALAAIVHQTQFPTSPNYSPRILYRRDM